MIGTILLFVSIISFWFTSYTYFEFILDGDTEISFTLGDDLENEIFINDLEQVVQDHNVVVQYVLQAPQYSKRTNQIYTSDINNTEQYQKEKSDLSDGKLSTRDNELGFLR